MSDSLIDRYGSAKRVGQPSVRPRLANVDPDTVTALGKLSDALEKVEHARGLLYAFHRLSGSADLSLQDAVESLRKAGFDPLADEIETVLVGRDLFDDLWSFQIVERYDRNYWQVFRDVERHAREVTAGSQVHLHEARTKDREQLRGSQPSD